jgi:hypothetical protein
MQDIPNALPWLVLCGIPVLLSLIAVARSHRHKQPPLVDEEEWKRYCAKLNEAKKRIPE